MSLLILAWLLTTPLAPPVVVSLGLDIDLVGEGHPEPVTLELGDIRAQCARQAFLRVGERRLLLTAEDGLWLGDTPPTPALLKVEVVDLTPNTPDRHLRLRDLPACDRDYSSWFDLKYGQHTDWLVGLTNGSLAALWTDTTHDGTWKVRPDGTWDVQRSTCVRPAKRRGTWDDDHSTVLAWGQERRTTERHRWTPEGIQTQVVRTRLVRSGCGGTRG